MKQKKCSPFQGELAARMRRLRGSFCHVAFCVALLVLALCAPCALAASGAGTGAPYVLDTYGTFTSSEESALETTAEELSSSTQCATYFLAVDDIGGSSVREYAKNYYTRNSLGYGSAKSGILFLVAVESRDYVTITYGQGTYYFTDYMIDQLESDVVDYLSDDDWYGAAQAYYEECNAAYSFEASHGEPLDANNSQTLGDYLTYALIALVAALVVGALVAYALSKKPLAAMTTAREKTEAFDYVAAGSSGLELAVREDRFVNKTVVAIPLPDPKHDSHHGPGGFGGGASIDFGGFGGSHGGKF